MRIHKDTILKIAAVLLVAVIIIVRRPELMYQPRFSAEEGVNYFSYAFSHSWFQNLTYPQYGYNTLYNSLATSFAAMFPLETAPLATTYLAFLLQTATSAGRLFSTDRHYV